MSKVLEQFKSRRSVKKYKPDPVPQEALDQIIEAGLYAANGKCVCQRKSSAKGLEKVKHHQHKGI